MAYQCLSKDRRVFFRKDLANDLSGITKIVFDFDGVLVQTSQSYRQTIRKVVDFYFLEILGLEGEKGELVTLGDVQKFKDTGLYNNDWNLSHAIIIYYLTTILRRLQQKHILKNFARRFNNIQFLEMRSFLQILEEVGNFLSLYGVNATELVKMKKNNTLGLESHLTQVKQNSLRTTSENVLAQVGIDQLTLLKKLVPYDIGKPDLLKRLFEESYLGRELFIKIYDLPSIFEFSESFLEKEDFIPTRRTLEVLYLRFGKFAIYSERPRAQGMYLLEKSDIGKYFDKENSIFQEDIFEPAEGENDVKLGKPNPKLFIELINKLVRDNRVAYVGDGVADVLLVKNARQKGLTNVSFLGVLCSSQHPNKLLSRYIEHGAEAIMTDVNDIPYLLASLGGDF